MKAKEHTNIVKFKENYETIKRSFEKHSSELFEILYYEQRHISEKGLRNIITSFGQLRRAVYANSRKNKEIYFHASEILEKKMKSLDYFVGKKWEKRNEK